jgi:response regulator RpfG family c-di-GMP phosphodiesterase
MFSQKPSDKIILIVEPSADKRQVLATYFSTSYRCDEADSVATAISKIRENNYGVVLAAITQRDMTGHDLIPYLRKASPNTVPVFLSEGTEAGNTVKAFRAGAFEVIQIPISLKAVGSAVDKAFAQFELKQLKENYRNRLEELVAERTAELDKALEEIENSYRMTLKALVQALETRDSETHGHSERVVTFSLRLGYELGLEKDALRDLELGALLHDIGKIGVPDAVLHKPASLNKAEWAKMKMHPLHGQTILRNIAFLEGAGRIVAQHHEKWDGSGYPVGMRGEEIELGARIFAVVDAFDAIVSDRVYRDGRPYKDALQEIEKHTGTQFDPVVVEAFKRVPEEDWEMLRERSLMEKPENRSLQSVVAGLVYSERQLEMVH